jgi:hypothetical protein
MATVDKAAWAKYFNTGKKIPTVLKKESKVFDPSNPKTEKSKLPAGTEIIFLPSKEYDPKPLVEVVKGKKLVRVLFDAIAKPGVKSSAAASLKPQAFGVKDEEYKFKNYAKLIRENIDGRSDLKPDVRAYLSALIDYADAPTSKNKAAVQQAYRSATNIPVSDIVKDFGEVAGPFGVLSGKLIGNGNLTKVNAAVYIPARPNEPLMDYSLIQTSQKKKYVISAKSGTTSNVVKPGDIINLINKDANKKRKWERTIQYEALEVLSQHGILHGPIAVAAFLGSKGIKEFSSITQKAADDFISKVKGGTSTAYNKSLFASFISGNDYLSKKKNPTANEIMYECEKAISALSKTPKLDFTKLFREAIDEQVYYIKFSIDSSGISDFDLIGDTPEERNSKVFLRSKNGYTRASDRMGIQI